MKKVVMLAMAVCSVVFTRMVDVEASEDIKEILVSGDYGYCILDDGTVQITNFYGSDDKIEIPDEIDGKMVSEIWSHAFSDCQNLTGIKIPNSVTEIGDNAFHGCENLKIIADDGSYAIQYAIDNGLEYEYIGQHDWLKN